jgi:hypothetical protein
MKLYQIVLSGLLLVSLQADGQPGGVLDQDVALEPIGGNTGGEQPLLPGKDTAVENAQRAAEQASHAAKIAEVAAQEANAAAAQAAGGLGAAGAAAKQPGGIARARAEAHRKWVAACGYVGGVLSMIAPYRWTSGVGAAAIAASGSALYTQLDNPQVQAFLNKLGESAVEADIDVPTLTALLAHGVWSGNKQSFSIAGWYVVARTIAKLVTSDLVTIGLSKLPLIGDELVSEQDLKRAENGIVMTSEKGAQATKIGIGILVFTLAYQYLPLVKDIKLPSIRSKAKQS